MTRREFTLHARLRREPRFAARRVPAVDVWAAGPDLVFHRIAGIVDSGASRTLFGYGAHDLLGIVEGSGEPDELTSLGGTQLKFEQHWIHFRLHTPDAPAVAVRLYVGLCPTIAHNVFGVDLLEYFTIAVSRHDVTFMAE